MAKDKDRTLNPAAAHLKSEKSKALKKSKAQQAAQRSERLAHRDPERLQRQVDELLTMKEAQGGKLRPRDAQTLEKLERDVRMIRKAKEAGGGAGRAEERQGLGRGSNNTTIGGREEGRRRGRGQLLGKRQRGDEDEYREGLDSEDTDPEVRGIPMPRDTPPPLPRRRGGPRGREVAQEAEPGRPPHDLPAKPVAVQTTYSSAPILRDLQKEATSKFVPAAVASRLKQRQGFAGGGSTKEGERLLEPEEVDALERGRYLEAEGAAAEVTKEGRVVQMSRSGPRGIDAETLEEEEGAFERELEDVERVAEDSPEEESKWRGITRKMGEKSNEDTAHYAKDVIGKAEDNMVVQEGDIAQRQLSNTERSSRRVEIEEIEDEDL